MHNNFTTYNFNKIKFYSHINKLWVLTRNEISLKALLSIPIIRNSFSLKHNNITPNLQFIITLISVKSLSRLMANKSSQVHLHHPNSRCLFLAQIFIHTHPHRSIYLRNRISASMKHQKLIVIFRLHPIIKIIINTINTIKIWVSY